MRYKRQKESLRSLKIAILAYDRINVQRLTKTLEHHLVLDAFLEIAFESDDWAIYHFVCDLIQGEETAEWEEIASLLLSQPFCHYPHAYERAFEHAKRAAEFDVSSVDLKEYLLFFNAIPNKLMTDVEANELATEILKLRPTSQVAKMHLL